MARLSGFFGVLLALTVLLGARRSPADESDASRDRAAITLIGAAAQSPELRGVLNELLERDNIETRFTERTRFGSSELLDTNSKETVGVFIVPSGGGGVRVYFRAPDGERFLVRDVTLSSGFDVVGRELIAQIVEASVVALLHSGVGLSREQVQAALDESAKREGREDSAPKPAVAATPPPAPVLSPQHSSPKSLLLEGWLAARYAAEWSGSALGIRNGPGLELGVGVRSRLLLRARLMLERDFPVGLSAGPIDARVTTSRWRTALDLGAALGENRALALSLGVGQDASLIDPTASRDPSVLPASSSRKAPTVAHAGVRFEAGSAEFQVALSAGMDVPLVRTPYDVDRGANAKPLATPWPVLPNAALSLAWRPQLGWF